MRNNRKSNLALLFILSVFFLKLGELIFLPLPALAYRTYRIPGFGFGVSEQGVTVLAFGQKFENLQVILFCAVLIAIVSAWFLYSRIVLGVCSCYCGPGKCECTCGCRRGCPCFTRDKSDHNDQARRPY